MGLYGSIGTSWRDVSIIGMVVVVGMGDGGSSRVVGPAQRCDFGKGSSRGWRGVGDVEACIVDGVFERLGYIRGGEARSPGTDNFRGHVSEDARLLGSEARAPAKAHSLIRRSLGAVAQFSEDAVMEGGVCTVRCRKRGD